MKIKLSIIIIIMILLSSCTIKKISILNENIFGEWQISQTEIIKIDKNKKIEYILQTPEKFSITEQTYQIFSHSSFWVYENNKKIFGVNFIRILKIDESIFAEILLVNPDNGKLIKKLLIMKVVPRVDTLSI